MPSEYSIVTPEKVAVEFRLAGIGSRIFAAFLDAVVMVILLMSGAFLSTAIMPASAGMGILLFLLVVLFVVAGYSILLESVWNGQTVGKKLMGIRVRMADGSPVTLGAAAVRSVLRLGDLLLPVLMAIDIILLFLSPRAQRLGDIAANTIVVHERRNVDAVPLSSGLSDFEHPLEGLVGDLRGMTAEEYLAIKTLCDRYPELPAIVQTRLTRDVWQPVANRYSIPTYAGVHPVYLMEAVVMKYARRHGLL